LSLRLAALFQSQETEAVPRTWAALRCGYYWVQVVGAPELRMSVLEAVGHPFVVSQGWVVRVVIPGFLLILGGALAIFYLRSKMKSSAFLDWEQHSRMESQAPFAARMLQSLPRMHAAPVVASA